MSDFDELFVLLAVIYLLESSMWIPRGRVGFGGGWSRRVIGPGSSVLGNGRRGLMFLAPWPPLSGAYLSARLRSIDDLGADADDPSKVRSAVLAAFDVEAIGRLRDALRGRTRALRVATHLLFVHLFGLAPALAFLPGLGRLWGPWLVGLIVLIASVEVAFFRAHRQLFPEAREDRWTRVLMLVSPPSAVRALDALMRPLLDRFHPVAIARVIAPREVFVARLGAALREIVHRPPSVVAEAPGSDGARAAAFDAALREGLERLARAEDLDPAALFGAPARHEGSSLAYCPRCHVEFSRIDAACDDCGGLAVLAFPEAPARAMTDVGAQVEDASGAGMR